MGQRYVLDFQTEELNFIVFLTFLRPLVGVHEPPKLGGWGSEQSYFHPLFGVHEPPKLGGWGSEQ